MERKLTNTAALLRSHGLRPSKARILSLTLPHQEGIQPIRRRGRSSRLGGLSGVVHDVTRIFLWPEGTHQALRAAGQDLTESPHEAPHDAVWLTQFPIVWIPAAD